MAPSKERAVPSATSQRRSATRSTRCGIVRDQEDGALEGGQGADQGFAGVDVEVVGGLVEDEELRGVAGRQREEEAGLFATRQRGNLVAGAVGIQTEARQLAAHLRRRCLR